MAEGTCSIDGCESPVFCRGWCRRHYNAWFRKGDPLALRNREPGTAPPPCSIDGCDKPAVERGWCHTHYTRWYTHGDPSITRKRGTKRGAIHNVASFVDMGTKRCSRCKEAKPLDAFYKQASGSQGRTSRCVSCLHEVQAEDADRRRERRATPEWRADARAKAATKRRDDPERFAGYVRQRRARRRGIDADLTDGQWKRIVAAYAVRSPAIRGAIRCAFCGLWCFADRPVGAPDRLVQEHLTPLVRGGAHSASNVVPACCRCNGIKHDRTPGEWASAGGPAVDLRGHPFAQVALL